MNGLVELSAELERLVAATAPAVASVGRRRGRGSGVVVSPDGFIATNSHVLGRGGSVRVELGENGGLPARVVGRDEKTDLAVVQVDASGLRTLPLADHFEPRVGQLVLAIGTPFSLDRSISLGVISALDRTLTLGPGRHFEGLIQTDAAINPGNSGGPLVDAQGQVLGINTAAVRFAQGIGFAIPARTAVWIVSELIGRGEVRRPRLGVAARSEVLPAALIDSLGQTRAIRIVPVEPTSPADRAGLRQADALLRANGRRLACVDDLQRAMVLGHPPRLELDLWRGRHERAVVELHRCAA